MATRSMIGFETEQGVRGRYVHWDGYPSVVGQDFVNLLQSYGLGHVVSVLTEHAAGFSSIGGDSPVCYCHSRNEEGSDWLTLEDARASGCEFAYIVKGSTVTVFGFIGNDDDWTQLGTIDWTDREAPHRIATFG